MFVDFVDPLHAAAAGTEHRRSSDPVVVTTRDIYDLALETKEAINSVLIVQTQSTATVSDHEKRLRDLEKWRYALPTSLILAVGSTVATIALYLVERMPS